MTTPLDLSLLGVHRTANGLITPKGVVFYYLYRPDGSAGGCVCFGRLDAIPVFCRGISFCSAKDQFSKKIARELAYRRYLLASGGQLVRAKIGRGEMLFLFTDALLPGTAKDGYYKVDYDVELSAYETKLWAKSIAPNKIKKAS